MNDITLYKIFLVALFAFAAIAYFSLLLISAPYGRHISKGWGYTVRAKLGWLIMEFPAFAFIIILFFTGNKRTSIVAIIFLLMWTIHYFQRTFIYPFLMKGGEKNFPVVIIVFALGFNIINGYVNGNYLFHFAPVYTIS